MSTLLFPGRHLVNTRFQFEYLRSLLGRAPAEIAGLQPGPELPTTPIDRIVFAITSSNQENSRYNPIPFYIRAIGVDRFARSLQAASAPFSYRIVGIPHYGHTDNFASFTLKEIAGQSERTDLLSPADTLVLCSTPEVIALYAQLGFSVAPAELGTQPPPATPLALVRAIGEGGDLTAAAAHPLASELSSATRSLFADFPEVPRRIARIYRDPLTNQDGSLTEKRNYATYARGMNEILRLKYLDIRDAIRPGRIVDEGCADGGLLAEIAADFPDSDLYGIDLSAEFAARFQERKRTGDFGNVYTCFYLRNLLDPIFEPESVDTTICNSTLHELWSYAAEEATVRDYLAKKFAQLRPGGRLIIRDVVGPERGDDIVLLECRADDGEDLAPEQIPAERPAALLQRLSTRSRFRLFATDFLHDLRASGRRAPDTKIRYTETAAGIRLTLRAAAEFLSKKDYTDNWRSEMNEEFCFWSFPQWRTVLGEVGFHVLDRTSTSAGSRVYLNSWIAEHRYRDHARLLAADDPSRPLDFPPTNMVLIAEKPTHTRA
ncbi:MAG: methyltransferase [Verrucomicrobiota bacterium]